jgi:hypothetical protein
MAKSGLGDPDIARPLGKAIVSQELGEAVVGSHRYGMEKGIPPAISPQRRALMVDSHCT